MDKLIYKKKLGGLPAGVLGGLFAVIVWNAACVELKNTARQIRLCPYIESFTVLMSLGALNLQAKLHQAFK